ncbi:MAG: hypothetical protein ACLFR2_00765 [Candidatus Kapaibacterium sp.]
MTSEVKNKIESIVFAVAIIIILAFLAIGCDVCDSGGGSNAGDMIYFSAVSLNGDSTAVYTIMPNGRDTREIAPEGMIFSPPSKSGKIVYLSAGAIVLANIDGSEKEIIYDGNVYIPGEPIISPDGGIVAFKGGDGRLLLLKPGFTLISLTGILAGNTIPAFSYSGKYLAFLENNGMNHILKVIDTDNPDRVILSRTYPHQGDKKIRISSSGTANEICFSWDNSNSGNISHISLPSGDETRLEDPAIGAKSPFFMDDKGMIGFVSNDNSLWQTTLGNNFNRLIAGDPGIEINNPEYNRFNQKIIYCKSNESQNYGVLYSFDINTKTENILFANAFSGYWSE